jgi:hypothetical protein
MVKIDNFASMFVGNSRFGWFVEGTTDGPAEHMHREFLDAVYYDSLYHAGRALMEAKIMTAPFVDLPTEYEPGAHRWNFYDLNILGDPLGAIWTHEEGQVSLDYLKFIPADSDSLEVYVTCGGMPLNNVRCALLRSDSLAGRALTSSDGRAVIHFNSTPSFDTATVVLSGYNLTPKSFELIFSDYWLGYNTNWSDPNNWYSGSVPNSNTNVFIPAFPAGNFYPTSNSESNMSCHGILIEEGALFEIGLNEQLIIHGN